MLKQSLYIIGATLLIVSAQEDNFSCPDEFEGYYPHLFSCDRYWKCLEGKVELKTCGNGLAFNDQDPTFTTENCDYIYNVDCGNRTELEPPIEAPNCPRLYGTFPDPDDCTAFYNCRNGLSNRYSCAPGLAYDRRDRVCKWADQVKACKAQKEAEDSEEVFKCPKNIGVGLFSKHPHPADCRQYFVCISGIAREYGCPLGTVFAIGNDDFDGKCTDPEDVPECSNYYGDLNFDKQELVRAGVDPEAVGATVQASRNRISRPTPASNQINDFVPLGRKKINNIIEEVEIEKPVTKAAPSPSRPSRLRPRPNSFTPSRPAAIASPSPSNRPTPTRPTPSIRGGSPTPTFAAVPATPSRPRFVTSTFAPVTTTTTTTTTTSTITTTPSPILPSAVPGKSDKQPARVKAGDDYYYYYYYYDDEEEGAENSQE